MRCAGSQVLESSEGKNSLISREMRREARRARRARERHHGGTSPTGRASTRAAAAAVVATSRSGTHRRSARRSHARSGSVVSTGSTSTDYTLTPKSHVGSDHRHRNSFLEAGGSRSTHRSSGNGNSSPAWHEGGAKLRVHTAPHDKHATGGGGGGGGGGGDSGSSSPPRRHIPKPRVYQSAASSLAAQLHAHRLVHHISSNRRRVQKDQFFAVQHRQRLAASRDGAEAIFEEEEGQAEATSSSDKDTTTGADNSPQRAEQQAVATAAAQPDTLPPVDSSAASPATTSPSNMSSSPPKAVHLAARHMGASRNAQLLAKTRSSPAILLKRRTRKPGRRPRATSPVGRDFAANRRAASPSQPSSPTSRRRSPSPDLASTGGSLAHFASDSLWGGGGGSDRRQHALVHPVSRRLQNYPRRGHPQQGDVLTEPATVPGSVKKVVRVRTPGPSELRSRLPSSSTPASTRGRHRRRRLVVEVPGHASSSPLQQPTSSIGSPTHSDTSTLPSLSSSSSLRKFKPVHYHAAPLPLSPLVVAAPASGARGDALGNTKASLMSTVTVPQPRSDSPALQRASPSETAAAGGNMRPELYHRTARHTPSMPVGGLSRFRTPPDTPLLCELGEFSG